MIDHRSAWALVLALMLAAPAASSAGDPADSPSRAPVIRPRPVRGAVKPSRPTGKTSIDRRWAHWLDSIGAADSAQVLRLDAWPVVSRDSAGDEEKSWDTHVVNQARVGREWIASFKMLVGEHASYDPEGRCRPDPLRTSGPNGLVLCVRFFAPQATPSAIWSLHEGCLDAREQGRSVGRIDTGAIRDEIHRLAVEALPRDAAIDPKTRNDERPIVVAAPGLRAPPPPAAPRGDGLPQPGEYVYAEELPEAITKVPPTYPDEAREAKVEGMVVVQALVGRDGSVKDVRMQKSIPALDAAAMACVREWKFKPATLKGEPVAVWVTIPVRFTLH
jgi:TonB family protein